MAIWYAQLAATDVSAANQWNAAPDGSGAWLTWASLGAADVLCANGKGNLYVSSGFTCATITTSGGGTGADGGWFYVQPGAKTFTLTTDIVAGTTYCLRLDHSSGTVAVIGDVTAGGLGNAYGIYKYTGAGTLTVEGAILGGGSSNCYGLYHGVGAGSATVVTGSATGGTGLASHGIYVSGAGASMTLYGTATGGTGGTSMSAGVCNNSATAVVTVNGNAVAGTGVAAPGVYGQAGPVVVVGSLVDSATTAAVAGKIYWQPASVAHYWQVALDGTSNQRYTVPPLEGKVRLGVNYGYYGEALVGGQLHLPAIADVKAGVGYGDDGTEYSGTLVAGGGGVPLIGPGGLVG